MTYDAYNLIEDILEEFPHLKPDQDDDDDLDYAALTDRIRNALRNTMAAGQTAELPNCFTVISVDASSGKIYIDHVEAENASHAFAVAAATRDDAEFVASLPGHIAEGCGIEFAGESVVDSETVRDQPDVFGSQQQVSKP